MNADPRKRILYVLNYLPFPPHTGGRRVSLSTLRELCAYGVVDMVCFDDGVQPEHLEQLRDTVDGLGRITLVPHKRKPRWWLPLLNITGRSYFFHRDRSERFQETLERLTMETQYDILFVETARVLCNVSSLVGRRNRTFRVIGQLFNVNSLLTRRYLNRKPWLWLVLWLEYLLSRREEVRFWRTLDQALFISSRDLSIASAMSGTPDHFHEAFPCPLELNVPVCQPVSAKPVILHVGTGSWLPNVDGLCCFLETVLPRIQSGVAEAVFRAVGGGMPIFLKRMGEERGVQFAGFVDDLEPEYQRGAVFVVPLQFGSGIKIKILDAMARGLPVVATPVAMEGIPFGEDHGVVTARMPEPFADAVIALLQDPERRREMGRKARLAIAELARQSRLIRFLERRHQAEPMSGEKP